MRSTEILRGELVWGHETRTFTECGGAPETASWVVDETGGEVRRIYEELSPEPYQPLFFEVVAERLPEAGVGFAAEYSNRLVVTEVRRAENEGWGCREDLSGLEFRGLGNEPFWSLEIRASRLLLRHFDLPEPLEWSAGVAQDAGETISYFSDSDRGAIEVEFREAPCVDTMAGSRFPFVVQVRLEDRTLTGCALAGDGRR